MTAHVFVDETKDRGYVMAAAFVSPTQLGAARKAIRGLVMPGQRRIHFHKESDARRKKILDAIDEVSSQLALYDGSTCLRGAALGNSGCPGVVLEPGR